MRSAPHAPPTREGAADQQATSRVPKAAHPAALPILAVLVAAFSLMGLFLWVRHRRQLRVTLVGRRLVERAEASRRGGVGSLGVDEPAAAGGNVELADIRKI